jgi:hypothetical protein
MEVEKVKTQKKKRERWKETQGKEEKTNSPNKNMVQKWKTQRSKTKSRDKSPHPAIQLIHCPRDRTHIQTKLPGWYRQQLTTRSTS